MFASADYLFFQLCMLDDYLLIWLGDLYDYLPFSSVCVRQLYNYFPFISVLYAYISLYILVQCYLEFHLTL